MVNNTAEAEDLFQETVIRFWRGLPGFKGGSKLTTWLYKIAYRVCLDALSSKERREPHLEIDNDESGTNFEIEDIDHSGVRIVDEIAARDAVERAMNHLPPEWRAMLILFYWRGLSMNEVAEITNRPPNTIKVYMHRARQLLRSVLQEGGYPEGSGHE